MISKFEKSAIQALKGTAVAVLLSATGIGAPMMLPGDLGAAFAQGQGQGQGGQGDHGGGQGGQGSQSGQGNQGQGAGQGGPDSSSDGKGPQAGGPADSSGGGKPVWAQEGIPEVELGRLSVARSPDQVLDRAFNEALSTVNADLVAFYNLSLEDALTKLSTDWDNVTIYDSPLQSLALLKDVLADGATSLPGVTNVDVDPPMRAARPQRQEFGCAIRRR